MSTAVSQPAADTSIARIGSQSIDAAVMRELLPPLDEANRQALAADPAAQAQLVRTVLVRRMVVELARRDRWDENPDVRRQIAQARDAALAESYLRAVTDVPASYPSEAELVAFHQANQGAFVEPARHRLAQLFIAVSSADSSAESAAQTPLDQVLAALAEPEADFAALVARFSDEKKSAAQGGEVGWLAETQLRPELRPLLADLKPGDVSRPVRLADGWHMVKCLDFRPSGPVPFAAVRDALANRMRAERAAANRQAYIARLLKENPVSINELELGELLKTAP